jgi:hypothetical protein
MRKTRAKNIRTVIDTLIKKDIISEEQRQNAERFFKRAWKRGDWKTVKEAVDLDNGV